MQHPKQQVKIKIFKDRLISAEAFEYTNHSCISFFFFCAHFLAFLIHAKVSEIIFMQLGQTHVYFEFVEPWTCFSVLALFFQ